MQPNTQLLLTRHVIASYAIFYPRSTPDDIRREVDRGIGIEPGTAVGLVGRRNGPLPDESRYVLHRERSGIFVLVERTAVTFLRFYSVHQRETAIRLWPGGDPPTCSTSWSSRPDPGSVFQGPLPKVPRYVIEAVGQERFAIQQAILTAISEDRLEPPGEFTLEGVTLFVFREYGQRLRVILSSRHQSCPLPSVPCPPPRSPGS